MKRPRPEWPKVGVSFGLRGSFAVLFDLEGPIQSGCGSFRDAEDAWREAEDWADAENLMLGSPEREKKRNEKQKHENKKT